MANKVPNKSINCSVNNCRFNCSCDGSDYCTLESIRVGSHELNPTECKCTDCESFILK